jgi:hypothetical protein
MCCQRLRNIFDFGDEDGARARAFQIFKLFVLFILTWKQAYVTK